jgi:CSLREA domain-containing protein
LTGKARAVLGGLSKAVLVLPLLAIALLFVGSAPGDPQFVYTVNSIADPSPAPSETTCPSECTLADAITAANNDGGTSEIDFGISGTGPQTIRLSSALPPITEPVTINGTTQPNLGASPFGIAIDGGAVTDLTHGTVTTDGVQGLVLASGSDGTTIQGLALGNFEISGQPDPAIEVDSSSDAIVGNSIGVAADGTTAAPNQAGILVTGDNNTIGGGTAADRNVVVNSFSDSTSNAPDGILVMGNGSDFQARNNAILGNYIGVLGDGTTLASNEQSGVQVVDGQGTAVGDPNTGDGNVIVAKNGTDGILLGSLDASTFGGNSSIVDNLINLSADGSQDYPDSGALAGINVQDTGFNEISGNTMGGTYQGIDICNSPGNTVSSNVIGSNKAGPGGADFGVLDQGISLETGPAFCPQDSVNYQATGNVIGGNSDGGNTIVGSQLNDVAVDANQNEVSYNTLRGTKGGADVEIGGSNNSVENNAITAATNGGSPSTLGIGVRVDSGNKNTIAQNSIHDNEDKGISLAAGANDDQAAPVLESASTADGAITVNGTYSFPTGSPYTIDVYQSPSCGPGQGATWIGAFNVDSNGTADQAFTSPALPAGSTGAVITATATAPDGSTSEFSSCATLTGAPNVFVVDTAQDTDDGSCSPGSCSLRDAINAANAFPGGGAVIDFAIGSGARTISPSSDLPAITAPVTIDGTSQPGYNGTPLIFLDGQTCGNCSAGGNGLGVDAGSGSVIKGLAVGRFPGAGIGLEGTSGNTTVSGSYIGIDPSGTAASNGRGIGIAIDDTSGNTIDGVIAAANHGEGGQTQVEITGPDASGNVVRASRIGIGPGPAEIYDSPGDTDTGVEIANGAHDNTVGATLQDTSGGNLIALIGTGVSLDGAGSGNVIDGNRIGLDDTGASTAMRHAVSITGTPGTIVGSSADPKLGNVIGGVSGAALASGILVSGSPGGGTVIAGNFLGVDRSLQQTQPNGVGVDVDAASGVTIGPNNTITNSTGDGVLVEQAADEVRITTNSIYGNGGLGIDLSGGSNDGIAPPTVTSVIGDQASGTVSGANGDTFTVELFGNAACTDAANGAGRDFLGSTQVTISQSQSATWNATLSGLGSDEGVTATATDSIPDTSQFSSCAPVQDSAADLVVTTNADSNDGSCTPSLCSLYDAITAANTAGGGTISFDLPDGSTEIDVSELALPSIIAPTTIDGYTQHLASTNTLDLSHGDNAFVPVELAGGGLEVDAGGKGSEVMGLSFAGLANTAVNVAADNVTVAGNFIGLTPAGADDGNTILTTGISVAGSNDVIGGPNPADRNVISNARGNFGDSGILLGSGSGVLVAGNYIGTNALGTGPVANFVGITFLAGARGDNIQDNVVSGNTGDGINVTGTGATGNTIVGNLIGTTADGIGQLRNNDGIDVTTDDTTIGGTVQGEGNVLSGNGGDGISVSGANGTQIVGNLIGMASDGTTAVANQGAGIQISATDSTLIQDNVVSGNGFEGMGVGGGSTATTIIGNKIGTDASGTSAVGNGDGGIGIDVSDASGTMIGGTGAGDANVVSGNLGAGIELDSGGNTVQGDFVGTDATGSSALGNDDDGIYVSTSDNTIGGGGAGAGNVISGNTGSGVHIEGSIANGNTVSGNLIGTDASGTQQLGNKDDGILINAGAANNTIGGTDAGAGNVISDNGAAPSLGGGGGVDLRFTPGSGNIVEGNLIGTDLSGSSNLGNAHFGVSISGSAQTIGGTVAGAGNTIAFNNGPGVLVTSGTGNSILGNSIHDNSALGIDLGGDGVTQNDSSGHTGPNNFENFPVLSSANSSGGSTTISGTLNSAPSTQYRVEFFSNSACDPSGNGQGQSFLGSSNVTTDGNGSVSFSPSFPADVQPGDVVTATATDSATGDTSEFSACATVTAGSLSGSVAESVVMPVDVTAAGSADWAIWGYNSSSANQPALALTPNVVKVGGGREISDLSIVNGDGTPTRGFGSFTEVPFNFSWSDGTPVKSASGAYAGLTAPKVGQGLSFTVPADTQPRTLTIWTSAHYADGTLTAHLSDGSVPDYTQTVQAFQGDFTQSGENVPAIFTIHYQAASADQHLTVTWTQSANNNCGGCEDVVIYAAALSGGSNTTNASASLTSGQTVGMAGANVLTSDIPLAAFDPQPPGAPPIETHGLQLNNLQLNNLQLNNLQLNNLQLNNLQLNNLQLNNLQLNNLQLNNLQLNNLQLNNLQLNNLQLNNLPLDPSQFPNGWAGVLAGTPLAGQPLQTITLEQVVSLNPQPAAFQTHPLTLGDLQTAGTAFGNMTIGSLTLIGAQLNNLGSDFQDSIENQLQSWCLSVVPAGDPNHFCGVGGQMGTLSLLELGLAGAPIQGLQLNNLQLNNLQLNNLQLNNLQLNNLSTSASGIAGMQLNNLQLNNLPFGQEGIGDLLVSSLPSSVQMALFDCTNPSNFDCSTGTLGEAQVAGAIKPGVTVGDLDVSSFFQNVSIVRLLQSVLGPDSAYATSADFGDFVGLFIQSADVQWETLAPDLLSLFDASRPSLPMTAVFSVQGTGNPPADVQVHLPAGFDFDPGTASLAEGGGQPQPHGDPTITSGSDGLTLIWHFSSLDPGVPYTVAFRAFSGTTVGGAQAIETVTSGSQSDSSTASFGVTPSFPGDTSSSTPQALDPSQDAVHLSALPAAGVVDWYTIPMPAAGTRVRVHLTDLPADYDLALYAPQTTSVRTGVTASPPLQDGVVPDQPINLQGGSSGPLTPTALEDIPDPGVPVVQVSDNRGTDDEDVGMVSPGGGGVITIAVFGYNGAFSPKAYSLRVTEHSAPPTQTCSARTFPSSAGTTPDSLPVLANLPQNLNTVILVDEKRLGNTYGANAETTALAKLRHLAGSDSTLGVSGVVVPVESITGVQALYDTWDANPCNPDSANAVANAIANYVDQIKQARGSLRYVVFAGGDDQIPFFRLPDLSLIANESGFAGQFGPNEYGGSLAAGDLLSDSPYLDTQPIPASGQQLFVPDLVGGRLVETATDIANAVTAFENSKGILKSSTAFVSGYDFVTDSSATIAQELGGILGTANVRTLPSPLVANPLVPPSWTATDLLAAAFPTGGPAAINDWNGHYDNTRTQAADGTSLISTSQLTGKNAVNGGIFFTMGCHAGFQTTDAVIGSSVLDWPQYFAQHKTGFVGNTGFGIGSTDSIGFDEELMADFAANLDGSLSLGDALVQAEDQYYLSRVAFSNYDEKTLGETELYGLPMYGVGHAPASLVAALSLPSGPVKGTSASTSPNQGTLSPFGNTSAQSASFAATPVFTGPITGKDGQFYTNAGQVQAPNYRPLQPYVSLPAGRSGLVAHGAVIDSLTSSDDVGTGPSGFVPDNVRPTLDKSANEPPPTFTDETWPEKIPTLVSLGPNQNLNLITGQFFTQTANNATTGVERKWTQINGRVTYSTSQDFTPPTIDSIDAFQTGQGTVVFTGRFSDLDQHGGPGTVKFAQVVFDDGAGNWNPVQLTKGTSGDWTGVAQFVGTGLQYFVEACDDAGNCGYSSNKGRYFDAQALPPNPTGAITLTPQGTSGTNPWFTGQVGVNATSTAGDVTVSVDGGPFESPDLVTITGDGAHTVEARDAAGDTATTVVLIDNTPPTKPAIHGITDGGTYAAGGVPTNVTCTATDATSGLTGCVVPAPDTSTGPHTLTATATDNAGNSSQSTVSYTVVSPTPPTITSANTTTFTSGTAGSFTVRTTGNPAPALTNAASGACTPSTLPAAITFTDNHDGTATIASTTATITPATYTLCINASNGASPDAHQGFSLVVAAAPATFAGITFANTVESGSGKVPNCTTNNPFKTGTNDVNSFPNAICSSDGNAPAPSTFSWQVELANGTPQNPTPVANTGAAITVTVTKITTSGTNKGLPPSLVGGGVGLTATIPPGSATTSTSFKVQNIGNNDWIQVTVTVNLGAGKIYTLELQVH